MFQDRDGQPATFPRDLRGISGCPVWAIGDLVRPVAEWRPPRVAGVQTGAYQGSEVIRATRWVAVTTLLTEAFPNLRSRSRAGRHREQHAASNRAIQDLQYHLAALTGLLSFRKHDYGTRRGAACMTLVLAICTSDGVVLAADSRVRDAAGNTREDAKIWELPGNYAAVTYGCGPPGVPDAMTSFPGIGDTTDGAARNLVAHLARLPPAAEWGLFLAGHDADGFTVAQGEFPGGRTRVMHRAAAGAAAGWWWAGSVDPSSFPIWRGDEAFRFSADQATTYALALLQHAGDVASDTVGPPYRALIVRADRVVWSS